jgi:hypothetical protein
VSRALGWRGPRAETAPDTGGLHASSALTLAPCVLRRRAARGCQRPPSMSQTARGAVLSVPSGSRLCAGGRGLTSHLKNHLPWLGPAFLVLNSRGAGCGGRQRQLGRPVGWGWGSAIAAAAPAGLSRAQGPKAAPAARGAPAGVAG